MNKGGVRKILVDIGVLKESSDYSSEVLTFVYIPIGRPRLLICYDDKKIHQNVLNLYTPGRSWVRFLFSFIHFLNFKICGFLTKLLLNTVTINKNDFVINIHPGLQGIFLGSQSEDSKITLVYDKYIEKHAVTDAGKLSLTHEISTLQKISKTSLSEFLPSFTLNLDNDYVYQSAYIRQEGKGSRDFEAAVCDYLITLVKLVKFNGWENIYPAHGDLVPWNIRINLGKTYVVDWESFNVEKPFLYDMFYYFFMQAALGVNGFDFNKAQLSAKKLFSLVCIQTQNESLNFEIAYEKWRIHVKDSEENNHIIRKFVLEHCYG